MLFILNSNKCSLIYLNGGIMAQKHEREVYKNRLKNIQIEDARRERSASIARQMQFSGYTTAAGASSNDDVLKIVELIYQDLRNDENEENNKLIESNANVIKSALKNAISVTQPTTGESRYARAYVVGSGLVHTDNDVTSFCLSAFSRAVVLRLALQDVQDDSKKIILNVAAFVIDIILLLFENHICIKKLNEFDRKLLRWIITRGYVQSPFSTDEAVEAAETFDESSLSTNNDAKAMTKAATKATTETSLGIFLDFGIIESVGQSEFRLCDVVTFHLQKKE